MRKTTDRSLAAASSGTLTDVLLSPLSRCLSVSLQPAVTFTLTGSHHMLHVKQLIKAALCRRFECWQLSGLAGSHHALQQWPHAGCRPQIDLSTETWEQNWSETFVRKFYCWRWKIWWNPERLIVIIKLCHRKSVWVKSDRSLLYKQQTKWIL